MLTRHWMRRIAGHWAVDRQRTGKTVSYRNGIDKNESPAETTVPDARSIEEGQSLPASIARVSRDYGVLQGCRGYERSVMAEMCGRTARVPPRQARSDIFSSLIRGRPAWH
jgi:hypothetical protein